MLVYCVGQYLYHARDICWSFCRLLVTKCPCHTCIISLADLIMYVSHLQGFSAGLFAFYRDANGEPLTPRMKATGKPIYDHEYGSLPCLSVCLSVCLSTRLASYSFFHWITFVYIVLVKYFFPGIISHNKRTPLASTRQHPSYGDCLEVKREYYQNCCVLDCVTQCSQSAAHLYEQFLQVQQIGFVTLGPLHCV